MLVSQPHLASGTAQVRSARSFISMRFVRFVFAGIPVLALSTSLPSANCGAQEVQHAAGGTERVNVPMVSESWSATLSVVPPAQPFGPVPIGRLGNFKEAKRRAIERRGSNLIGNATPPLPEGPSPLTQSLGVVFDGPGTADVTAEVYPPDPVLAVGPSHVVVCINDVLAIYSKTGTQQGSFQHFSSFFSSLGVGNFFSDPRVLFDQKDGRFVVVIDALSLFPFSAIVTESHVLVAVSQTSDPTGMWNKFALDFKGRNSANSNDTWADFPTLGLSSTAIYITTNQFEFCNLFNPDSCNFSDAWIKVIDLQELLTGSSALNITTFTDVRTAQGEKAGAIQPAITYGASSEEFLVAAFFPPDENVTSSQVLNLFSINTTGTPVLGKIDIAVPSYGMPPEAPQPGTSIPVATGDYRPVNAVWRGGSLWCAHPIADATGSAAVSRWYEISASSISTTTLKQIGTVYGSGDAYYPAVAVNATGDTAIVFTTSSSSQFASAAYTGRVASDVLNSTRASVVYRQGTNLYDHSPGQRRWGDYSGTAIDPSDGSIWVIAEYAVSPNPSFRTAVGQVLSAPALAVSPVTVTFGELPPGNRATPISLTVTNIGTQPLNLGPVILSGKDSADFQLTGDGCSNITLALSSSCIVSIGFSPSGLGTRAAQLSFAQSSTGSPQGTVVISLTGRGVSLGLVTLSATSLSFGSQRVGTTSTAKTVVLTNTGTGPLGIAEVSLSGDFAQTNTCIPSGSLSGSLGTGNSCTISVTFTPRLNGPAQGQARISHDAAGSPTLVSLSGMGVAPQVNLSPGTIGFPEQRVGTASNAQTVTLANAGDGPLAVDGITVSGEFTQTNNCGTVVTAGSTCSINIVFSPLTTGTRTGQVFVTDNAAGSPHLVNLTGTGVAPRTDLSPTSLSFSPQLVGTTSASQPVTVRNTGTASLSIHSITPTGEFAANNGCGSSLGVGVSCTVSVTFTPTAAGTRFGTLTVTDDAPGSPHSISLSGTGSDFSLSASPSSAVISAGQSTSHVLTVTPLDQFQQTVSLTCTGAPAHANCSISSMTVTLDGTHSQTTMVVVTTTGNGFAPPRISQPRSNATYRDFAIAVCVLFLAILTGFAGASRRRLRLTCGLAALLAILSAGCNLFGNKGTPPGSYMLTLTGTSGGLSHTTTINLLVN